MSDTESRVNAFFADVSAKGMEAALQLHGSKDVSWWICGMGDVTGQLPHLSAAFTKIFDARGMVITPQRMISKGDFVTVEALTDCAMRDGTPYRNTISYWIELSGDKIVSLREYFDSAYGQQIIGAALAEAMSGQH